MTKTTSRENPTAIGTTVTRIAGTAAIALTLLLGISAATQPAAARVIAPLPAAAAATLAAAAGAAIPVTFKRYGGYRGRSFKGGHRFGGFGYKKPGFSHGFHGSRYGSFGFKKFGHSGIGVKKFGSPVHGLHGKTFRPHGFYGYKGYQGFKRY